jgi:hypothetical protein
VNPNIPRHRRYTPFERVEKITAQLVALGFHPFVRRHRSHWRIEVELWRKGDRAEQRTVRPIFNLGDRWGLRTIRWTYEEEIQRPVWIVVHKISTTGFPAPGRPGRRRLAVPAQRDRHRAFVLACRLGMVPEERV